MHREKELQSPLLLLLPLRAVCVSLVLFAVSPRWIGVIVARLPVLGAGREHVMMCPLPHLSFVALFLFPHGGECCSSVLSLVVNQVVKHERLAAARHVSVLSLSLSRSLLLLCERVSLVMHGGADVGDESCAHLHSCLLPMP